MKAKLEVLPPLTRAYILQRVSEEEIMEFYMHVPVDSTTLTGNSFTSPMREDNNATCNYYYAVSSRTGQERLKFRDWNGSFHGDTFDVASHFTKIKINTSQGFNLLLHKIAYDFKIHKYSDSKERVKLELTIQEYQKRESLRIFKVIPRSWNGFDRKYWWDRFGISSEMLKQGRVIPVQELHIEGKDGYFVKSYSYISRDPAFAYYGGKFQGITLWRIYLPLRKKGSRFLSNSAFLQGANLIQPAKIGIITKSLKDVLVYRSLGFIAIAVPSETYLMSKDEYFDFAKNFDVVFTNFDYDKTGIRLANKYKKVHNCFPLMFTKGKYKQPDFGVKDMSEFRERYGKEKSIALLSSVISDYEEVLQSVTKYNYESLKWIKQ